jgi:hypothetical protein
VPSTFGQRWPPPCPSPWLCCLCSHPPFPQLAPPPSTASGGSKGSTPPWSTLFLPPPPLHLSCAAPNTAMIIIIEPPQTARSSPSLTVRNHPRALVHRRATQRPSRLPPRPPVPPSTVGSPSVAKAPPHGWVSPAILRPISASTSSAVAPWTSPSTSPTPSADGPPLPPSFPSANPHHRGRPHR